MKDVKPTPIPLDELLRHAIRMRSVHRAVGYDVTRESEWIAELRRQIREQKTPGQGDDRGSAVSGA